MILVDMNLDSLKPQRGRKLLCDLEDVHGLCLITKPTRLTDRTQTLLEHRKLYIY